jgi:hypothetical protein
MKQSNYVKYLIMLYWTVLFRPCKGLTVWEWARSFMALFGKRKGAMKRT